MGKSAAWLALSFIFLSAVTSFSCNNSIDDMLGEYNGQFTPVTLTYASTEESDTTSDEVYEPGDDKFYAEDMLYPSYVISQNSTLNLAGPRNCSSYRWTMTDPDDEKEQELSITLMNGYTKTTRKYVLYVPQSGLYASKTFKLKLTVLGNDGHVYTDTCGISVYKDYYFSESSNRSIISRSVTSETSTLSSRMIVPESYTVSDTDLHYYLYAKSAITGAIFGPNKISVTEDEDDPNKGTILVDLPKSSYNLTLYCTKGIPENEASTEVIKAASVLIGYASADTRYNQSVVFYMQGDELTRAGYASLKVYTDEWSLSDAEYSTYSVSAEVLNSDGTTADIGYTTALSDSNLTANTAPANPNLVFTAEPGTYLLKISFSDSTQTFSWSDSIVINPGSTTTATIGLPLIIYEVIPDDGGGG